ncbi:ATP-binding protein [uncultured Lutibacter sp.]|uniref:sensor histidine kinase n=1 Tax=uncultured Lutibacter sp. TaxID=437739 RepID=UPI00261C0CDF|nr:ATP-binding protein [uncultured Lutibacter sp.]
MITPEKNSNEKERLIDLKSYSILDTLPESDYDNLTAIAAEICGTKISLVSLIDEKRQWFKSHHGINASETPREYAFCGHAINDQNNVLIVQDARKDIRFHDNPLVTQEPFVIFYAGVPLISDNGHPLGTLCVIDNKPKLLSQSQIQSLSALASQVTNLLKLRKSKNVLEKTLTKLQEKNKELERFAYIAAHDLKSPLIGISSMADLLSKNYTEKLDHNGQRMLELIQSSSNKLNNLIDGLLKYTKSDNILKEVKSNINLEDLKRDILGLFNYENELSFELESSHAEIETNRAALEQILINLIANAIKYNDKKHVEIKVNISSSDTHYKFSVQDNGPGIAPQDQEKIFDIFEVLNNKDKYGNPGNGIGLATVKKIIEKSGGSIHIESTVGKGSIFIFNLKK